jgi:uncharacterized membrane protein YjdF
MHSVHTPFWLGTERNHFDRVSYNGQENISETPTDEYERQRDKMATILWRKRKKYTDGE